MGRYDVECFLFYTWKGSCLEYDSVFSSVNHTLFTVIGFLFSMVNYTFFFFLVWKHLSI